NAYVAVLAHRRDGADCALETIERVNFSGYSDFETLVVFVAAGITFSHRGLLDRRLTRYGAAWPASPGPAQVAIRWTGTVLAAGRRPAADATRKETAPCP